MQIWQRFKCLTMGLLTALTFANVASAKCEGTDLRAQLSTQDHESFLQDIAQVPYPSGNHWRASKDGKTIHLIGTIHLDDPRLDDITERLQGVIETSELLLLEISPEDEDALKTAMLERPELIFLQDTTLPELIENEDDWQDLSKQLSARGVPAVVGSRFQPWYVSVLLGIPACLAHELMKDAQMGLDNRLRDIAQPAGIDIASLEAFDTLFHLFNDAPLKDQIDILLMGLEAKNQELDMFETVISAYYEENHAQAWEMTRRLALKTKGQSRARTEALFAEMENDLLLARNQAWIPVILEALETRSQITVAAGAGHFSGALGVLMLLELEGFTLERLPF